MQLGHGVNQHRIRATMTSLTSSLAVDIASDKELTNRLLAAAGLPVPASEVVRRADDAVRMARRIGYPVVLKPLDGNHGRGVAINLNTEEEVRAAFDEAYDQSRRGYVLVESFITGKDYRVLVVGGHMVAIAERVPAHVIGDGGQDGRRAGRDHQRRPAARRRAREGAHPHRGHRRRRSSWSARRATR